MKANRCSIKKILLALVIAIFVAPMIIGPVFGDNTVVVEEKNLDDDLLHIQSIIEMVENKYVGDITREELIEGALKGVFNKLDEHSSYYNPEEFSKLFENVSGDFSGIGVYIRVENDYVTVVSPIIGTPADKAGLKPGDKIESVDGTNIKGYTTDEAAKLIKGEPGTTVRIGIIREGENDILYFDIVRAKIEINPISYEIMKDDIGYIQISQFNAHTLENIKEALTEMDNNNIEDLVIDLRYNPGGFLDQVIEVLKFFVPEGPIVHINYSDDNVTTYSSKLKSTKYDLVVLVNGGSASASEIFAGAIQDSKVGTVVGTQTFGKGTVQTIYPFYGTNGVSGVKITVAEYLTPNKRSIDGKGITPDIVVENETSVVDIDLEDIPKFRKKDKPGLNHVSLDVLAAEQILSIIGYDIGEPDGVLDPVSFKAIKKFQLDNGLFGYGILDYTTQDAFDKALSEYITRETEDTQLQKAIEILKNK